MALWTIYIKTSENELGYTRTIKASGLNEAKQSCLGEIKRALDGNIHNLYLESRGGGNYLIISDMDEIGEVEIQRLIRKNRTGGTYGTSSCHSKDYYDTRLLSVNPFDSD